jgi:hypothetical protein
VWNGQKTPVVSIAGADAQKTTRRKITHRMNFENIKSTEDLETVSEEGIWQNFERLAGFIFEKKMISWRREYGKNTQ